MREINVRISFPFYLLVERNAPDSIGTTPTGLAGQDKVFDSGSKTDFLCHYKASG